MPYVREKPVRPQKVAQVQELKEKLARARSVVLANNKGLTVAEATKLRKDLRPAGVEMKVAKNTLIRIAARELGIEGLEPLLHGTTTLFLSYQDEASGAKLLTQAIAKEKNPKLEIKGGILENRVIDVKGVKELADLPPRDVLLAQVLGGIQAPLAGLAGAINGLLASFAYALDARIRQLEEGAGA